LVSNRFLSQDIRIWQECKMPTPLSAQQRRRLAAGLFLVAFIYLFLTAKEYAASVFASKPELAKLQRAVWLSPGNADYRHRLGRFYTFLAGDSQAAIDSYRAAVALDPYDAHYWFDLAAAYEVTGDLDGRRAALDRAVAADPTTPDVAWEAANFFLVQGDIDRALREFRVVIENDISLVDASLQACWRVRPDTDVMLRDVVPARTDTLLAFVNLMTMKQDTEGAIKAWERVSQLHEKFGIGNLFDYVRYMIRVQRPDAAMAGWEQAAPSLGLTAYLPSDDNLIVNGDFSQDILDGGFDWTYAGRPGVKPLLDSSDVFEGRRSLSLTFEGPGIADAGIQHLISVRGGTTYDFSAYFKAADFEGAGGAQIVLRDVYTGVPLYTSDPLRDADFWKEVHSKIVTPPSTTLLNLAIERSPAGSPIRGKLWLDDFQLSPDDASDDPSDNSKDTP
jgi:tetratricopeptide (TPR) repeat protein